MSESHFGKVFRKRLGVSFRDYLQMARVARAQQLLLEPGKSILDIAVEVGYADTASFTHAFKKVCGASPTEYRNAPRAFKRIELPHAAGQRVHE
jgi:AraC-like DNA-binding protein